MFSYTIMSLDTDHVKEICADIIRQYDEGIADCALFSMSTVPEGNPVINKAFIFGEKYKLFRDELAKHGKKCGILVQSSIGHGYPLNSMFPFQQYVKLTDGEKTNTVCPYDEGFAKHFEENMALYASLEPEVIMLDDDFRLINRPGRGCACPLHMAEFNRRAGTDFTREELYTAMCGEGEKSKEYCKIFAGIQHDALIHSVRAMRKGIDSVNPKLQGIFCACGSDPAGEIAQILAGEGNPSVMRINNGRYTAPGARNLTSSFIRAALQISAEGNKADYYLAETDTCPQNRYSTAASSLHSHYTGSILEGASGAKHWITRLSAFEPKSGEAYRKMLAEYSGFYNTLSQITKDIIWEGCRIPLPTSFSYKPNGTLYGVSTNFADDVLERLGIPLFFAPASKNPGGAACINGNTGCYGDDEIMTILSGTAFIASDSAKSLIDRGYGKYLGVDVRDWNGVHTSGEIILKSMNRVNAQNHINELVPLNDKVEEYSYTYHLKDGKEKIKLFPAVTYFENSLGGKTVVFCGTPKANFSYIEAFSFLTESRKAQFIDILSRTGNLPVYYPEDAEVYLRSGVEPDGTRCVAFFNIGLDFIENITLVSEKPVISAEYLDCSGKRKTLSYSFDGEKYIFDISASTLMPVILFLKTE